MAINDQIGGSQEAKLLHAISKQLDRLNGVASKNSSGGGGGGGTLPTVWTEELWQAAYNSYTRPTDWLTLPTLVDGDQKVVMLHKVDNTDGNFCAFIVEGAYTVDWGDGSTPVNYASGATALKNFDYNASGIASQTPSVFGYRQVIVTVTPQAGQNLTRLDLNVKYSPSPTGIALPAYSTGWLDVRMAGNQFTRIAIGSDSVSLATINVVQRSLEIFDYVGSVSTGFNNTAYMFYDCSSLQKVVNLNTSNVTLANNMFYRCSTLKTIPLINLSLNVNTSNMFFQCYNLIVPPFLDTSKATNISGMFNGCASLKYIPLFVFTLATTGSSLFAGCVSLITVPNMNFPVLTNAGSMFQGCSSLVEVPPLNLPAVTAASLMFSTCISLKTVGLLVFGVLGNTSSMFSGCSSLITVPLMNFSTVTTATSMFLNCVKLSRIPQFNFISLGSAATMFDGCSSLTIIPAINMSALTVSTTGFRNCFSLTKILAYGLKGFVNVANNMLSRASLELLFKNLGNDSSTPIDITGNYGADAPIVRNVGQVAGSTTYTMVDTTNVVVGMTIQTLGNRTAVMQAGGINVGTLANHGLTNGKLLYITGGTATGIPNRVPHYVINATTNTFQMSLTVGGPSITVVTNGNLGFNVYGIVTSVTPGVGFTSDIPAIATGTSTPAIRLLDTSQASAKGYTITG